MRPVNAGMPDKIGYLPVCSCLHFKWSLIASEVSFTTSAQERRDELEKGVLSEIVPELFLRNPNTRIVDRKRHTCLVRDDGK